MASLHLTTMPGHETASHDNSNKASSPNENPDEGFHEAIEEIDAVKEKILLRKLDLNLIPVIMLVYLVSFLDRGMLLSLPQTKKYSLFLKCN